MVLGSFKSAKMFLMTFYKIYVTFASSLNIFKKFNKLKRKYNNK